MFVLNTVFVIFLSNLEFLVKFREIKKKLVIKFILIPLIIGLSKISFSDFNILKSLSNFIIVSFSKKILANTVLK